MAGSVLRHLFEYNNWGNLRIIEACSKLSEDQLDAEPTSSTKGSIRLTLWHLMAAQQRYVWRLTGEEPRFNWQSPPPFAELREAALVTGERLLSLVDEAPQDILRWEIESVGHLVDPWVVMVQTIYHAGEHREQIKSMLSALEITPPEIDGWLFGETEGAMRQAESTNESDR